MGAQRYPPKMILALAQENREGIPGLMDPGARQNALGNYGMGTQKHRDLISSFLGNAKGDTKEIHNGFRTLELGTFLGQVGRYPGQRWVCQYIGGWQVGNGE